MKNTGTTDEEYYERLRERLAGVPDPVCAVCRKPFKRLTGRHGSQITCSPHCSLVYARCRNYFNPEAHDMHVRRNARNILAHPEKHSPKTVARAKAIVDGEAVPKRVVRKNSEVYLLLESVGRLDLLP
jgi:hypothetical protein